jgi:hypothetical protein
VHRSRSLGIGGVIGCVCQSPIQTLLQRIAGQPLVMLQACPVRQTVRSIRALMGGVVCAVGAYRVGRGERRRRVRGCCTASAGRTASTGRLSSVWWRRCVGYWSPTRRWPRPPQAATAGGLVFEKSRPSVARGHPTDRNALRACRPCHEPNGTPDAFSVRGAHRERICARFPLLANEKTQVGGLLPRSYPCRRAF